MPQSDKELREMAISLLQKDRGFYQGMQQVYLPLVDDLVAFITSEKEAAALEIAKKWELAEEVVENGRRYLIVDGKKLPYGYPYPDTKLKYMISQLTQPHKEQVLDCPHGFNPKTSSRCRYGCYVVQTTKEKSNE